MEFLPMARFRGATKAYFAKFSELRTIEPVAVTMDLELCEDKENIARLDALAAKGYTLFPVRRVSADSPYPGRKDFPQRVLFEMTSICNTKCRMCPQMNLKRKLMHIDKEKYKSVIDELNQHGIEGLWLYHFGESLVHPHFKELVEYVNTKKNLGYIWLSTNGILLDGDMQDFLLRSSLSFLNFSLQSISNVNYKKIAPLSPSSKILANLDSLIKKKQKMLGKKPFFRLQIIEQEHTVDEIDPFLRNFYEKCDLISVNMLEHTDLKFNKEGKSLRKHNERTSCKRIQRADCFINSDGSVAICDNAYNNQMDIGNIGSNTVYEIWNGSTRSKILQMNKKGSIWNLQPCAECTDYDL
ncbi:MAG: SPASM domain-containing protein [Candidatus Omnitrophica bacterium]|nr:SPASM domain-containing protein [Candidatus Omnitrophota bacterium]